MKLDNYQHLPVAKILPELRELLKNNNQILLYAPPGAGKTTLVPPMLISEDWLNNKKIIMLEPRRIAARAAAYRISEITNTDIGSLAGYITRLDSKITNTTRIEILTEGILIKRLLKNQMLDDAEIIIFDEFHERHLQSDSALALCLDIQKYRNNLRIIIMSATLEVEKLRELLPAAKLVSCEGKQYPVQINYLQKMPENDIAAYTARAIRESVINHNGDILVFLPGIREIRQTQNLLSDINDISIIILHGNLPREIQDSALKPNIKCGRRIILTTSLAETSITVPNIKIVIDSGWQRLPRYDIARDMSSLQTIRVTKANAEQRAGRAGRTENGICYRLWTSSVQKTLLDFPEPEINHSDLTELVLQLAVWGTTEIDELDWLNKPPAAAVERSKQLLMNIGAIDKDGGITQIGRKLSELPVHPRIGFMLLKSIEFGRASLACDIAAIIEEPLLLKDKKKTAEFAEILKELFAFRIYKKNIAADYFRRLNIISTKLRKILGISMQVTKFDEYDFGWLLAYAYPDRICRRRNAGQNSFLLANGRAAKTLDYSDFQNEEWLVAADIDLTETESIIKLAAPLYEKYIFEKLDNLISETEEVKWSELNNEIEVFKNQKLGAIYLKKQLLKNADENKIAGLFIQTIRTKGIECLNWNDETRQLQQRIIFLKYWISELNFPDLSNEQLLNSLDDWLFPHIIGKRKLIQLKELNLSDIFLNMLDWKQKQALEKFAPQYMTAPSGSKIKLKYDAEKQPVMAVRIQEMFGCADTPAIANGKIKVKLHLLSPAMRPAQITDDLKNFWADSYQSVKKELFGRYPKHFWPDNPANALPPRKKYFHKK